MKCSLFGIERQVITFLNNGGLGELHGNVAVGIPIHNAGADLGAQRVRNRSGQRYDWTDCPTVAHSSKRYRP